MSALGGNGKFKDLLKFADENSVNIYPDIDIMSLRKGSGDYSLSSDVVRTMFNYKGEQYVYSRSVYNKLTNEDSVYLLNGDSVMRASNTFFTKYKNRFGGNISLTGLADNLYSDFGYKKSEYKDKAYYKNLTAHLINAKAWRLKALTHTPLNLPIVYIKRLFFQVDTIYTARMFRFIRLFYTAYRRL